MIFNDNQLSLLNIDPLENATLETLLNKNPTLKQLLSVKNIQSKIRSGFSLFIKYCQRHEEFCNDLIDMGIKSPFPQPSNMTNKQLYYIAADALTCDQDIVSDLLILPDKSKPRKVSSGNQSDEVEQIEQNIESEQNTAPVQQNELIDQSLSQQQQFVRKYRFLQRVLDYVVENDSGQIDQNCINYMVKTLNCLVRKKSDEFLDFLDKRSNYLKRLIELNNFSSISQFLIKILSDQDIHANFDGVKKIKHSIIAGVLEKLKQTVSQEDFSERLDFLDQLFQTNKYASEDDRTELQKLSDIFSSKATIDLFYYKLLNPQSPTQFYNAICYLSILIKRMNIDEEVDPYSYSNEPKEETMVFEMDILFKDFPKILSTGYTNLLNFKFLETYKQKMAETRFYDMLVLLTKNSRFSNSQSNIKHQVSQLLTGNNIIFTNKQEKYLTLKQLIKQFFTQAKSGINRISIISLIEKAITIQIYQQENHQKSSPEKCNLSESGSIIKERQQKQTVASQQVSKVKSDEKDCNDKNSQQDCNEAEDKKKKINQFKNKLKLDIKKFTNQSTQSTEKQHDKTEISSKKVEEETNIQKLESSLKKTQVIKLLELLTEQLKSSTEFGKVMSKKKLKNNDTEITALVNKIVMLLCNAIVWQGTEEKLAKQKDDFINEVQSLLAFFNFEEICRNYSTTLATSKHPNATAKQKTNPELNFVADFVKNYSKRKQQPVEKGKQSAPKNLELSDSEFRSEQDDQEEGPAVSCSIEEFKKLTGFKFQTDKIQTRQQPLATDRNSTEANNDISIPLKENKEEEISSNVQAKTVEENVEIVSETLEPKFQEVKKETVTESQKQPQANKQEETKKQVEMKTVQKNEEALVSQRKETTQVVKVSPTPKVLPLQFYVHHRVIFV